MNRRVLIIDQDPSTASGLEAMFIDHPDLEVRTITDMRKVDYAITHFEPEIVLLGLQTASPVGLEVLRQLRVARMSPVLLPVIVIAADSSRLARNSALVLGANDFLAKPLDSEEVLVRLRNLLHMRTLYVELASAKEALEQRQHPQQAPQLR